MHGPADTGDVPVQRFIDVRGVHPWIPFPDRPLNHMIHHMALRHEVHSSLFTKADELIVLLEKHATNCLIDRPRVRSHHCIEVQCHLAGSQEQSEGVGVLRRCEDSFVHLKPVDHKAQKPMSFGSFRLHIFAGHHCQRQAPHLTGCIDRCISGFLHKQMLALRRD